MSIIYSYPIKGTPANDDLILISDSASSPQFATKQIKVSSLPGGSASGVSSFNTLTGAVTITGGTNVTLNPVGNNIEINASGGGDTYTLQAEAKSNNSVPLKLDAAAGSDSTVNLTEGSNVTLTRNSANEITIAATGGNAGVSSFTNTNGTYISAGTENSAATGAVTVGTIDLSAVDGTSDTTTRFLSKDNTWDVPSYTTDTMGSGNGYAAGLVLAGNATHGDQFLRKDGTWQTVSSVTNTNIGGNNLILTNNRTLNFYSDTTDKSLTFIGGDLSGTKTLFKFDTVANKPRFTVGDTTSTYEGNLHIMGNGSSRTGYLKLFNAAGTNSVNIQAPTTFGSASDIPYVLPNAQGTSNTYLKNDGSGGLSWGSVSASPDGNNTEIQYNNNGSFGATDLFTYNSRTLSVGKVGDTARSHLKVYGGGNSDAHLTLYCSAGTHGVTIEGPDHTGGSNYTLKLPASLPSSTNQILESNASGALSWINTPTGGGGSLGFAPLEIYSASTTSSNSHSIYYMVAVCDVDFTVYKCKVAVTSGNDPVYVAVYSMNGSTLQNSTLTQLGALNNSASIVGVNELSLTDSAFGLTAGQTICIGISTSNILASGPGINNTNLGLMNNGGGSALPINPDFEGFTSSNSRPAIHFYAS